MAVQPRPPDTEAASLLSSQEAVATPSPPPRNGAVIELTGRRAGPRTPAQLAFDNAVEAAILPHQLNQIDNIVEIAHLQEMTFEKDARIALLTMGIAQWRERALSESDARRREQQAAHDRERELIRVIHQQLATVDSAEWSAHAANARVRELEASLDALEARLQQRSRHWWQRSR